MRIKSVIYLHEEVKNQDKKFGANDSYYPVYIKYTDGSYDAAFFTENDLKVAKERAEKNPEDVPEKASLFWRLIGLFID